MELNVKEVYHIDVGGKYLIMVDPDVPVEEVEHVVKVLNEWMVSDETPILVMHGHVNTVIRVDDTEEYND
jgi:hypothetical protein